MRKLTPKEKAKELYDYYYGMLFEVHKEIGMEIMEDRAELCALRVANEALAELQHNHGNNMPEIMRKNYWEDVEDEILKLH